MLRFKTPKIIQRVYKNRMGLILRRDIVLGQIQGNLDWYCIRSCFLFQSYSLLLYIINIEMGRKLRSRLIQSDTDHQNEQDSNCLPIADYIRPSAIRKNIRSKLSLQKSLSEHKVNKFKKTLNNSQFGSILHPSRFQCSICLQLMVNPVIMMCGHAYCYRCLQSNAAYNEKCCLCRSQQNANPYIPFKLAQTIVENFLLPYGPQLIRYLCRTTDSAEWAKRRRIQNIKQGLVIDFQDKGKVWRRGVIVNASDNEFLEIKVNIKGTDFFQKVERTSRRIAPFTFFTRSRYLEDFPTILPEHDPTQAQFSKIEYRNNWNDDSGFNFPQESSSEQLGEFGAQEQFQDEALRIFNSEMNEIDSILNF